MTPSRAPRRHGRTPPRGPCTRPESSTASVAEVIGDRPRGQASVVELGRHRLPRTCASSPTRTPPRRSGVGTARMSRLALLEYPHASGGRGDRRVRRRRGPGGGRCRRRYLRHLTTGLHRKRGAADPSFLDMLAAGGLIKLAASHPEMFDPERADPPDPGREAGRERNQPGPAGRLRERPASLAE